MPVEEDAGSEASDWELRERRERGEEREAEAGELGAAGELCAWKELPLFLPAPSFIASADEDQGGLRFLLLLSFVSHSRSDSFLRDSPGAHHIFWTGLGGGQRGACNVPPPRGQQTGWVEMYALV